MTLLVVAVPIQASAIETRIAPSIIAADETKVMQKDMVQQEDLMGPSLEASSAFSNPSFTEYNSFLIKSLVGEEANESATNKSVLSKVDSDQKIAAPFTVINEYVISGDMNGIFDTLMDATNAINEDPGSVYVITLMASDEAMTNSVEIAAGKEVMLKSFDGSLFTIKKIVSIRHLWVFGN